MFAVLIGCYHSRPRSKIVWVVSLLIALSLAVTWLPSSMIRDVRAQSTDTALSVPQQTSATSGIVSPDGWGWHSPLPQGNTLHSVWGSSPSDVFAVGDLGTILHYNGSAWSAMNSGTTNCLWSIWGSSATDVFAVGEWGTILHYNGVSWSAMPTGLSYPYDLHGIWGSSTSDVFAVGNEGTILHYDGASWSTMTSNTMAPLRCVWGTSSSDVFAAGGWGAILHYDGSAWEVMESGSTAWFGDVWGASPTDVFAVCDYGNSGDIFHYDGVSWSAMTNGIGASLRGIWGSSATDVFAVGSWWDGSSEHSTMLHWDGGEWRMVDSGAAVVLWGVWGSGAQDVFAVGAGGCVIHYPEAADEAPTLTSVDPDKAVQSQTIDVTLEGSYFVGATAVGFGAGIEVNGFHLHQGTRMTANITVSSAATAGSRDVSVTTPAGTATLAGGFSVIARIVSPDGWGWQNPLPQGNNLQDTWGSSGHDVFAVGDSGTVLHYNGSTWSAMTSGTTNDMYGVWGNSSSSVFTVGSYGTILRYDGFTWSAMTSGTANDLNSIWGSSASAVFAVGSAGTILSYNGTTWSAMNSGTTNDLYGVWGTSSEDIFAVGGYLDGFDSSCRGVILHYDGSTWSTMSSGTTGFLVDVWGSSANDVFAVGGVPVQGGSTILHYDGSAWHAMNGGTYNCLYGVWGSSASDVFAVGYDGTVMHCNGTTWSAMTSGTEASPIAVWGNSSVNVFVVGSSGIILHYDGSTWNAMTSGIPYSLNGLWGSSSSDVFAVGYGGTILHYDGNAWGTMNSGTWMVLQGVWGSSSSDVFAVGWDGTILHYDGNAWSAMNSGTTNYLYGLWGSSSSDVFAVGDDGTVLHYDGDAWSAMNSGTTNHLYGVWGSSASDIYAVGGDGTNAAILHYDGNSWSTSTINIYPLTAVWGSSNHDVFVAGYAGDVLHYDGNAWSAMNKISGIGYGLLGVWGSSSANVFAVGYPGTILHYDGNAWSAMRSGTNNWLLGVWGSSATDVFAVGEWGTILHYPDTPPTPPTITSVSPDEGNQGESLAVTISGTGLGTAEAVSFGSGITVTGFEVYSATQVRANITIDFAATLGARDVLVTTSEGMCAKKTDGFTVTRGNQAPLQPGNVSPVDLAMGVSLTPTLQSSTFFDPDAGDTHGASQWQVTTATGDYSSPAFDSGIDTSHLLIIDVPAGRLNYSTTYYWHVRHQDNHGAWSTWSTESRFTTAAVSSNQTPDQPSNVSPANTATAVSLLPTLESSAFSDPDAGDTHTYSQWQMRTSTGDFTSPAYDSGTTASNLTSIDVPLGVLSYSTTYYWHVRHQDNHDGWSPWSTETSFTTTSAPNQQPGQPVNVTPAAGAIGVSLTPTLSSSAFFDPDAGDAHAASQWQITATAGDYSNTVLDSATDAANLTGISVPSGILTYSATYYWRVRHQDNHSVWSSWSTESGFTTLPPESPPSVSTLPATGISATGATLNGDLTSLGTADNVWVCFEWGLTDNYGSATTLQGPMGASGTWSYPLSGLTPGTTYHFRAKADGDGGTAYGSDGTFTTGQIPEVEDVDPSSGKRNQDLTVTISGYHLDGAMAVSFGSGITVEDFSVNSSTEIITEITIAADATLGDRDISVTTGSGTATKTGAFSVVGGGGGICGAGAPAIPHQGSEMTTTLAALGLLSGVGYVLVRRGMGNRKDSVRA